MHIVKIKIKEIYENRSTKTKLKEPFLNKKVDVFKTIDDPMQWQKQQRDDMENLGFKNEI